jgi:hypothetical protein
MHAIRRAETPAEPPEAKFGKLPADFPISDKELGVEGNVTLDKSPDGFLFINIRYAQGNLYKRRDEADISLYSIGNLIHYFPRSIEIEAAAKVLQKNGILDEKFLPTHHERPAHFDWTQVGPPIEEDEGAMIAPPVRPESDGKTLDRQKAALVEALNAA